MRIRILGHQQICHVNLIGNETNWYLFNNKHFNWGFWRGLGVRRYLPEQCVVRWAKRSSISRLKVLTSVTDWCLPSTHSLICTQTLCLRFASLLLKHFKHNSWSFGAHLYTGKNFKLVLWLIIKDRRFHFILKKLPMTSIVLENEKKKIKKH